MTYRVTFEKQALKEWEKLNPAIKDYFKKILKRRIENPKLPSAKVSGATNVYKIKYKKLGYRLVYIVIDKEIRIEVLSVGKRNRNEVYQKALLRMLK